MLSTHEQLDTSVDRQRDLRDANSCIAVGAGLGAWGLGTALLAGATCPLCVIVAPALIGVGAWKRFAAGRRIVAEPDPASAAEDNQRQTGQRPLGQ